MELEKNELIDIKNIVSQYKNNLKLEYNANNSQKQTFVNNFILLGNLIIKLEEMINEF